ncbi:MAG: hypothetical protein JSV99_00020, partial [Planctomycetota bacterium]
LEIRRVFKCAHDIKPEWHIRMQAAFQQHCDAAVGKTINLGEKATVADVDKAYKLAFKRRCKGITVYRNKSRPGQVLQTGCSISDSLAGGRYGAGSDRMFSEQDANKDM